MVLQFSRAVLFGWNDRDGEEESYRFVKRMVEAVVIL